MAKLHDFLSTDLQTFIENQKIFFVGTARSTGTINVSPKGLDALRIINPQKIVWLNLTGSGNETATHLEESKRMTILFCAFEGKPLILRLYGTATTFHATDPEFQEYIGLFPDFKGARQIFEMNLEIIQTSCGYAVPYMDFKEERPTIIKWAENRT